MSHFTSPMMKQWYQMKQEVGEDVILFCRVGDFYELFYKDAEIGARELDITLTSRRIKNTSHPLAGVPVRSVDLYVGKLVNKGYRVAIADQLEDPKQVKGVVQRGVTRIVTRGTLTEDSLLNDKKNNYIASIYPLEKGRSKSYGLTISDFSCGEFRAKTFNSDEIKEFYYILETTQPVEVIIPQSLEGQEFDWMKIMEDSQITYQPDFWFDLTESTEFLQSHFEVKSLKGFGIDDNSAGAGSSGALLRYLYETQKRKVTNITSMSVLEAQNTLMLDRGVIRSLELFENSIDHTEYGSLVALLDRTSTPMGARDLKKWISAPLTDTVEVSRRHDMIEIFLEEDLTSNHVRSLLESIADIERITARVALGIARPTEIVRLVNSLGVVPQIRNDLKSLPRMAINFLEKIPQCDDIIAYIKKMIKGDPASSIADGEVIAEGVNSRLDELRAILLKGERWIDDYVEEERLRLGIPGLKIKQNRPLGYYIEIPKAHLDKVPEDYTLRQAMVNGSRFATTKLKDWETDILNAEVEVKELEQQLYNLFLEDLSLQANRLLQIAMGIAELDVLLGLALLAQTNNYVRPKFISGKSLLYQGIRHPVIESFNPDDIYTPNDVSMSEDHQRVIIITGPNFSGKSSLLRAVALNTIMAQIGSFVAASQAEISIIDRIFTRIGASDNLIAGQSTFMVEMLDAANLVNNCTPNSLIIADELGRGTSTYDGLAIAWSITEYLHNHPNRPFLIIATHFHQLAELEGYLEAVRNYHFKIGFNGEIPIFDHKLLLGSSDKSFGVEVAKLAGLPKDIILRARFILKVLESQKSSINDEELDVKDRVKLKEHEDKLQGTLDEFFGEGSEIKQEAVAQIITPIVQEEKISMEIEPEILEVIETIRSLTVDEVTPIKALELLAQFKEILQ